jgi:hypothetical protein
MGRWVLVVSESLMPVSGESLAKSPLIGPTNRFCAHPKMSRASSCPLN